MLKLLPPIWALVYVVTAAAISWFFGWSKVPGLPLAPLGISLVAISWILPVWAIVLFRREGTEVEPLRQPIVSLLQAARISLPAIPCIWVSLFLRLASQSGSAHGRCLLRP